MQFKTTEKVESKEVTRRHWFTVARRFRLKTFLLVVVVLAAGLSWYASRAIRQKAAVDWVENNGGHVTYSYEFDYETSVRLRCRVTKEASPPGFGWPLQALGIDFFDSVAAVEFVDSGITNASPLVAFSKLKCLELIDTELQQCDEIESMPILEILVLTDLPIDSLSFVLATPQLKVVDIRATNIRDLSPLMSLDSLESLTILESPIADFQCLKNLESLRSLELDSLSRDEIKELQVAMPNCQIDRVGWGLGTGHLFVPVRGIQN